MRYFIRLFGFTTILIFLAGCATSGVRTAESERSKQLLSLEDHLLRQPGVTVRGGDVYVRGPNSITGNGAALFEINGIVLDGGFQQAKDMVSALDIVYVRVLKNPDELSIYGARGLTGVVQIKLRNSQGE